MNPAPECGKAINQTDCVKAKKSTKMGRIATVPGRALKPPMLSNLRR